MKTRPKQWMVVTLIGALIALLPAVSSAQRGSDQRSSDRGAAGKPASKVTAIIGADVHTVSGGVIRRGTVLIQDGKILDVGQNVAIPEGANVIDATGKVVTPGFVAVSATGIGVNGTPSDNDQLADALNPFDRNIKYALGVGITTGCLQLSSSRGRGRRRAPEVIGDEAPQPVERFLGLEIDPSELITQAEQDLGDENTSLCPCCGLPILPTEPIGPAAPTVATPRRHAVIKMSYGNLESMLVKEDVFYDLAAGSLSSPLNRHNWRLKIKQARQPAGENVQGSPRGRGGPAGGSQRGGGRGGFQRGGGRGGPTGSGGGDEKLRSLVNKQVALRIQANTVDEIHDMIALAKELDYKLVIEGAVEGWLVANELGEAKVPVIYTPRQRRQARRGYEDTSGSSIESTGIYEESGVPFAIAALSSSISMGGLAGRDLTSLPLEAAFAVRGGASEEAALRAMTLVPAEMLGLQDRIGSIEKGKDADLLILNGTPLDYRTFVQQAIVAGKVCYDREADQVYPVYER